MTTPIDLRSDTVTRPDAEMRCAMAAAEVGDDVFREDPTVRELEEAVAGLLGRESALFVPSGTMGNQIALHLHGRPGGEVLAEASSHIFLYELGAMAAISGLMPKPLPGRRGFLDADTVRQAIAPKVDYRSATVLVAVENTHNAAGGTVATPADLEPLVALAREHGLPLHLDGARIWNAAVALDLPPAALAAGFDSVMVCLSKGLGCPVGSLLVGSADFVARARRVRKMLGGGMRQVGVLAAAGLVAIGRGFSHLAEDHTNARWLAQRLADLPRVTVDPTLVATNIVLVDLEESATGVLARLATVGVLAVPFGPQRIRLVTHRDVGRADVETAFERLAMVLGR